MTTSASKPHASPGVRRYLVHLSCVHNEITGDCRYLVRVQPWTPRSSGRTQAQERSFGDERGLIEAINPLLPAGSDVRNVLGCIESAEGFLYLLYLNPKQAASLGWHG